MAHPYADRELSRKLGGARSDKTLSEDQLTILIEEADTMVDNQTGQSYGGWSETDTGVWAIVKEASRYFVSSAIREMFDDNDRISNDHYQRALDLCARIVSMATGGTGIVIASQTYETYPASQSGSVYARHSFVSTGGDDYIPDVY